MADNLEDKTVLGELRTCCEKDVLVRCIYLFVPETGFVTGLRDSHKLCSWSELYSQ